MRVVAAALAAVGWAYLGMAAVAYAALVLLDADAVGELGPMTAAAVVLAVGGSVRPRGDVGAFGMEKSATDAAIDVMPLGVSLVGALLLGRLFTRSLRQAGAYVGRGELAARVGVVAALFTATLGGLAWAGSGKVTVDGEQLPLAEAPGLGGPFGDALEDIADAQTSVGFTVDTVPSLLGGLAWCAAVLLVALASARRAPLPRGWEVLHRTVRPAASALRTVAVLAVGAALAGAGYVAATEDHSARTAGGALAGAPNGAWLALPLGLFVRWHGSATGQFAAALPDPLDDLLSDADEPVTVARLAELDGRVWLLALAAAMLMLTAGVLTAVHTPDGGGPAWVFAVRCGLPLGAATALALPLLAWLTGISADASLSAFGVAAVGGGVELHGGAGWALALGAAWGTGAGAAGALLARATGAAGGRVDPYTGDPPGHRRP
jgi:hypothetical protein